MHPAGSLQEAKDKPTNRAMEPIINEYHPGITPSPSMAASQVGGAAEDAVPLRDHRTTAPMRLAIDVGGVLIERAMAPAAEDAGEDTVFTPGAVRWVAGALEGIQRLAALGYELWILSFCGARREAETRIALQAVGVDRSIPVERWLFCRKRTLKVVLMREHDLDLLVDDREDNVRGCQREGFDVIWFEGRPTDPLSLPSWAAVVERFERERALVGGGMTASLTVP